MDRPAEYESDVSSEESEVEEADAWKKMVDGDTVYYWNLVTDETTDERPAGYETPSSSDSDSGDVDDMLTGSDQGGSESGFESGFDDGSD